MAISPSDAVSGSLKSSDLFKVFDKGSEAGHVKDKVSISTNNGEVEIDCKMSKSPSKFGRHNGIIKNVSFHIFNFATLGLVGFAGRLCSESSAMGTTKNDQNWLQSAIQDYGQTYRNATEQENDTFCGVSLGGLTKRWSNMIADVTLVNLCLTGTLRTPKTHIALNQIIKHDMGVSPSFFQNLEVDRGHVAGMEKEFYQGVAQEMGLTAENGQTFKNPKFSTLIASGSDSLQQAYLNHCEKEFSPENAEFAHWSFDVFPDSLGITDSTDFNTLETSVSKQSLYNVAKDYIGPGSSQINVSFRTRGAANEELTPIFETAMQLEREIGQESSSIRMDKRELQKLQQSQAQNQDVDLSLDIQTLESAISVKESHLASLKQQFESELSGDISASDNPEAFKALHKCHQEITSLSSDTIQRFIQVVQAKAFPEE